MTVLCFLIPIAIIGMVIFWVTRRKKEGKHSELCEGVEKPTLNQLRKDARAPIGIKSNVWYMCTKEYRISYDVLYEEGITYLGSDIDPSIKLWYKYFREATKEEIEEQHPTPPEPEPTPEPEPIPDEPKEEKPEYVIGFGADWHFDMYDTNNSEYEADMKNAFQYFFNQGAESVMSCGDIVQYQDEEFKGFYNLYKPYYDKGMRLFTCLGNHDYLRLYDDGVNKEKLWQDNIAELHCMDDGSEKDIHFFEYGAKWDAPQRTGTRNAHSKQNYWIEIHGDIYVFMSVDYKEQNGRAKGLSQAINLLDKNNQYVKQIKEYVNDTPYNEAKEKNFDYRFYDPEVLVWLKDILEANTEKLVFVFGHHFLPHKSGNGNSLNGKWFYSQLRVWPYTTNEAVNQRYYAGSNTLCGLQFWFLNKMNNLYKNVYWFSGHSHIQFADEAYQSDVVFCNHDYDIVLPDGYETTPLVDDIWTLRNSKYDYKIYTRKSDNPICECGLNIHLPSISKPLTISDVSAKTLYGASEGMLMEVYKDKVVFKPVVFKEEGGFYINKVIESMVFLRFPNHTELQGEVAVLL